ncbi:MAG: hypothetical protein HQK50_07560 [Oligoflexia bacterium]|nr:hypothetical protein [Oligoflexia bacterium]
MHGGFISSHSYIEVTTRRGQLFQIGGYKKNNNLEIQVGNRVGPKPGTKTNYSVKIKYPEGMPQDEWDQRVINSGKNNKQINSEKRSYEMTGGDKNKMEQI